MVYNEEYWDEVGGNKELIESGIVGAKNSFFEYYIKLLDKKILKTLPDLKDKNILDCGCGLGRWSFFFQKKGANVTGVDISKKFIETCRKKAKGKIKFECLDISKQALNKKFDFVFLSTVLQHIYLKKDFEKAVSNLNKMLRYKGQIFMIETAPPSIFSPFLQIMADRFKRVKDCSYRSFCTYKKRFREHNLKFKVYHGVDLSFPITYGYYTFKFLGRKNWMKFFYHTEKKSKLDKLVSLVSSLIDKTSDFPFLKKFTLIKIMVFEKESR